MTEELEIERGTGNVFADLGLANSDVEQTKSLLAAEIIRILDEERLSVRGAEKRTGVPYTDFSRIRNVDLDRFTIDRLMKIVNRFDRRVEVHIAVKTQSLETAGSS
jgi:predicted XRE-type DNA-binding protein